jgi:hypothetical protein
MKEKVCTRCGGLKFRTWDALDRVEKATAERVAGFSAEVVQTSLREFLFCARCLHPARVDHDSRA